MNDSETIVKKKRFLSPDKIVLGVLSQRLRSDLAGLKRGDALFALIRSISIYFREVGEPPKWVKPTKISGNH